MEFNIFGIEDNLASITDGKQSMSGIFVESPNKENKVIYSKSFNTESQKFNMVILKDNSIAKFMKISRPMSAVITDDGIVAVATITNQENFTWGLEFYEPSGKKIKALKGYGQKLYLSPDSKFLITQALNIKEAPSRSREINVYDMLTYKKIITTINPIWEKHVSFDTEKQTVTFERDIDDATSLWVSATMSLKTT